MKNKREISKVNGRIRLAIYVLGIFLFQEFVLRVCYLLPELSNFDRNNYITLSPKDREIFYNRNKNWHWISIPDTSAMFVHETNRYGFRDVEWSVKKQPGVKRFFLLVIAS